MISDPNIEISWLDLSVLTLEDWYIVIDNDVLPDTLLVNLHQVDSELIDRLFFEYPLEQLGAVQQAVKRSREIFLAVAVLALIDLDGRVVRLGKDHLPLFEERPQPHPLDICAQLGLLLARTEQRRVDRWKDIVFILERTRHYWFFGLVSRA